MSRCARLCFLAAMLLPNSPTATAAEATLRISELTDVDFGEAAPTSGPLRQRTTFCVSMDPRGPFQIIAIGSGANSGFAITNEAGSHNEIRYSVRLRGQDLTPGVPFSGLRAGPRRLERDPCARLASILGRGLGRWGARRGAPTARHRGAKETDLASQAKSCVVARLVCSPRDL